MGAKKQKEGKHKLYGPKMAYPRISKTKETRLCGPLGYAKRCRERGLRFTTRAAHIGS